MRHRRLRRRLQGRAENTGIRRPSWARVDTTYRSWARRTGVGGISSGYDRLTLKLDGGLTIKGLAIRQQPVPVKGVSAMPVSLSVGRVLAAAMLVGAVLVGGCANQEKMLNTGLGAPRRREARRSSRSPSATGLLRHQFLGDLGPGDATLDQQNPVADPVFAIQPSRSRAMPTSAARANTISRSARDAPRRCATT